MLYLLYMGVLLAVVFFLYREWQYAMVFHPKYYREPQRYDEKYRFLYITTQDGCKLEGCVYEPKEYSSTLLYFGGRGQDSVGVLPKLSECYKNVRLVTFNYRGYGKSEGRANEAVLMQDGELIYEKVVRNFGETAVMGFSLGSSVAACVASKKKPKQLFLIAPFASLKSLTKDRYGFGFPWLRFHFPTCSCLAENKESSVCIFVSLDDEIIPKKHLQRVRTCKSDLACWHELQGRSHAELLCDAEVVRTILSYISSVSRPSQNSS